MPKKHNWEFEMKPLQFCLSASIVLGLLLSSANTRADDAKDAKDGKKKTVRAVVVADDDGDSKTIRIEGSSLEEVHRLLAEKLKDLPPNIRKQIEAGLKQAKTQQHGKGEHRTIVQRVETKKSSDAAAQPKVRVQARAVRIGADGKAEQIKVDPKNVRVRIANKDGSVTEATKNIKVELKIDDDNPKIERRIRFQKGDDKKSAHPAHDGEKKVERRIIIGKIGADHAHGDHKHEHDGEKKVEKRIVIGGSDLGSLPNELRAKVRAAIEKLGHSEHAHGDHKHEHSDEKKIEKRIVIGGSDLGGLNKELHNKIRAAIEKLGQGDSGKQGSPRVIIMQKDGKQGIFELKEGSRWHIEGDAATLHKKLQSHAAEIQKAAAKAHKHAAVKIAQAKKVDSGQSSNVNKRLDKIEGELKAIRKLLEGLRNKD